MDNNCDHLLHYKVCQRCGKVDGSMGWYVKFQRSALCCDFVGSSASPALHDDIPAYTRDLCNHCAMADGSCFARIYDSSWSEQPDPSDFSHLYTVRDKSRF